MSLIVEDGTGKSDAESYISVADADTYHSKRGNTAWAALATETKEVLLRKAADYMVQVYRTQWAGARKFDNQGLDWPRYDVPKFDSPSGYGSYPAYYLDTIVPGEVKVACAELAYKANIEDLAPDIERLTKREKVGTLEVEYDNNQGVPYKRYRSVDNVLRPMLISQGSNSFVSLERV